MSDEQDIHRVSKSLGYSDIITFPVSDSSKIGVKRAVEVKPGNPEHFLIMNDLSYHFHEKSFLKPAQEQAQERAKEKSLRKIKIPKVAGNCLNPVTTSGLCVTHELLEAVKLSEERSAAKKIDATNRSNAAKIKYAEQWLKAKRDADLLLQVAFENRLDCDGKV